MRTLVPQASAGEAAAEARAGGGRGGGSGKTHTEREEKRTEGEALRNPLFREKAKGHQELGAREAGRSGEKRAAVLTLLSIRDQGEYELAGWVVRGLQAPGPSQLSQEDWQYLCTFLSSFI